MDFYAWKEIILDSFNKRKDHQNVVRVSPVSSEKVSKWTAFCKDGIKVWTIDFPAYRRNCNLEEQGSAHRFTFHLFVACSASPSSAGKAKAQQMMNPVSKMRNHPWGCMEWLAGKPSQSDPSNAVTSQGLAQHRGWTWLSPISSLWCLRHPLSVGFSVPKMNDKVIICFFNAHVISLFWITVQVPFWCTLDISTAV